MLSPAAKKAKPDSNEGEVLPSIKYGITELSDVILVVKDQEFFVHKMTLASRSKYFQSLFFGNFKEQNQIRIEIEEVSRVAFKRLLDFIYYGKMLRNDEAKLLVYHVDVKNIDFGKLITRHQSVSNKEDYIRMFWENGSEMLNLADRFDVRRDFQNYFQDLLDHFICNSSCCFVCITIHMFGFAHGLHFEFEKHKRHDWEMVKEWINLSGAAGIDRDDDKLNVLSHFLKSLDAVDDL